MTVEPVIMVAEGKYGTCHWRQYLVITDARVAVVHMEPAILGGWRFQRVDVQGGDSWPGMSAADIVRYKQATNYAPDMAPDLGGFRERLLSVAALGTIPTVAA